jgi:hypothetical protein
MLHRDLIVGDPTVDDSLRIKDRATGLEHLIHSIILGTIYSSVATVVFAAVAAAFARSTARGGDSRVLWSARRHRTPTNSGTRWLRLARSRETTSGDGLHRTGGRRRTVTADRPRTPKLSVP